EKGSNDHLDHPQKCVRQRLDRDADVGPEIADSNADEQPDEDLRRQTRGAAAAPGRRAVVSGRIGLKHSRLLPLCPLTRQKRKNYDNRRVAVQGTGALVLHGLPSPDSCPALTASSAVVSQDGGVAVDEPGDGSDDRLLLRRGKLA